jgi:hypothetical protein
MMKSSHPEIHIVKELLKAIDRNEEDIRLPWLEQEELDRYADYLVKKGLVTLAQDGDDDNCLRTSTAGKALLKLMQRLGQFVGEKAETEETEEAEYGNWTPARGHAETEEWYNRLLLPYVLEQAEVARLEVQLRQDYDEEAMEELGERMSRLETLENLRETMRRITDQKMDTMFDI